MASKKIQVPVNAGPVENPDWVSEEYSHWATEETLQHLLKKLEKRWNLDSKGVQEFNDALNDAKESGEINKKTFDEVNDVLKKYGISQKDFDDQTKKTQGSLSGLNDSLADATYDYKKHVNAVGDSTSFWSSVVSPTFRGMNEAVQSASSMINRFAGEFAGIYFAMRRMMGPLGAIGGILGSIAGASIGLTFQKLNEELEMFKRGLMLTRLENGKLVGSSKDFTDAFNTGAHKMNISFDELTEVFGEYAFGLRHQSLEPIADATKNAHANLKALGYSSGDTAKIMGSHMDQLQRLGAAQRMDQAKLSERITRLGSSTNYFAQALGKSREEVKQSAEEFTKSIDTQYALQRRFSGEQLKTAQMNAEILGNVTSGLNDEVKSGLREMFSAEVMEGTDFFLKLKRVGGDDVIEVMRELRDDMGTRKISDTEMFRLFKEAFSTIEDDGLAGKLDQFGQGGGGHRAIVTASTMLKHANIPTKEDMEESSKAGAKMAANLDMLYAEVTKIKNSLANIELVQTLVTKSVVGIRQILRWAIDNPGWALGAGALTMGGGIFAGLVAKVAAGWLIAQLSAIALSVTTSVLGALGLGGLLSRLKTMFGQGTKGGAGTGGAAGGPERRSPSSRSRNPNIIKPNKPKLGKLGTLRTLLNPATLAATLLTYSSNAGDLSDMTEEGRLTAKLNKLKAEREEELKKYERRSSGRYSPIGERTGRTGRQSVMEKTEEIGRIEDRLDSLRPSNNKDEEKEEQTPTNETTREVIREMESNSNRMLSGENEAEMVTLMRTQTQLMNRLVRLADRNGFFGN